MLVVIEKSPSHRRWHSESRAFSKGCDLDKIPKKDAFIREKRNPLLDRVKDTKLSCFQSSEVLSQFQDDGQNSRMDVHLLVKNSEERLGDLSASNKSDAIKRKDGVPEKDSFAHNFAKNVKSSRIKRRNADINESFNGNSCLGAKLKSISDRFLKSSTNRLLAKMYKSNEVETGKKGKGSKKLRSFSYGALPGLEEFHNKGNPLYIEVENEINQDDKVLLVDNGTTMPDFEDGDSGIIVNDSTSCVLDALEKKQICHSRSASGEQGVPNGGDSPDGKGSPRNRDSWSSDRTSLRSMKNVRRKRLTKRSVSLDRREVLRNYQRRSQCSSEGDEEFQDGGQEDEKSTKVTHSQCKRVFKVIRLFRSSPDEELGIFIAKTKLADQGAPGYLIAHIVPDGLADR